MSAAVIRPLTDNDLEAVIALWHSAGVSRPWNDPAKDIAFAHRDPHSTVLVAKEDDRVVASVMVGEDGHRGWVYYVSVDPNDQGKGLGRQIMDAAEAWLAERKIWKLNLLVRSDNTKVIDFYKHLGYADTNSVCLQKVLKPAG
jgi:ribosomal protein S18 acetylase RimI-like enzyme